VIPKFYRTLFEEDEEEEKHHWIWLLYQPALTTDCICFSGDNLEETLLALTSSIT